MKIEVKKTVAPNIDSLITPETNIVLRCLDCQSFLLPDMIHVAVFRYRDHDSGEARSIPIQICPVCYDKIGSPEYYEELTEGNMPQCYFVTLTRHQYEQTKKAEEWGMVYDPKTDEMRTNLLVH